MLSSKKKLGAMSRFNGGSPGSSNPPAGASGHAATPPPFTIAASPSRPSQLQAPPDILPSREALAEAAKISMPRSGRYAGGQSSLAMGPPAQHKQSRGTTQRGGMSSDRGRDAGRARQNGWEDSTVGSMLEDTDNRAPSDRHRSSLGSNSRHYDDSYHQRSDHIRDSQKRGSTDGDFLQLDERGFIQLIGSSPVRDGLGVTDLNESASGGILNGRNSYESGSQVDTPPLATTPTRDSNSLRSKRLPDRGTHGRMGNSHTDGIGSVYDSETNSVEDLSPAPTVQGLQVQIARLKAQQRARQDRVQESDDFFRSEGDHVKEREYEGQLIMKRKRPVVLDDLMAFDEPHVVDTNAAVVVSSADSYHDGQDAVEQTLRLPRPRPLPLPNDNLLQEKPLGQTHSLSMIDVTKKRPRSLDYDDAELNLMTYGDLQKQEFDYDPQAAALQQTAHPTGGSIEERLDYYRGRDAGLQREFFTRLSAREWEESGDWFTQQFSSIVHNLKSARREKRLTIERFENEIAAREQAVRAKTDGVGRTLRSLKQEGLSMMQGKDVDLEP